MTISDRVLIGISLLIAIVFLSITNFISALLITAIITGLLTLIRNKPDQPTEHTTKSNNTKSSKTKSSNTSTNENPQSNSVFVWPELNEFQFDIVGESDYQSSISELIKPHKNKTKIPALDAYIIPEDTNPDDDKAIRIDIGKYTVGYLSKKDARSFRRRLAAKKLRNQVTKCKAIINGASRSKNSKTAAYSVALNIKPFS